ncbi:protein ALP1-like [Dioscorea cayenensis subsp. rotundata]|uniref:Protein ALP1-like n=1 Tax=Dioscorea cayennensis subsp. rotundata TaxID=55577 RepID=A0AB40BN35_DIOCR|nr:protein ALP1-like [Dioscorea cayenensis subsp. rotundata]
MDSWALDERVRPLAPAFATFVVIVAVLFEELHILRTSRCLIPSLFRDLPRKRYFNNVLRALCALRDDYVQPPNGTCHPEIETNPNWYPFFKDCIGLLDGTHIDASVPIHELPHFRGRKGPTQNILAGVNPDLRFTYVLAGWEGSANDFTVLRDALSQPQPEYLKLIEGKYYLVDAGYTTMNSFIALYRGVKYHLKEHNGRVPLNHKELFNLRHSMLRSRVERAFAILKNRFKILTSHHFFPYKTQVLLVIACCIIHNYISGIDPNDQILRNGNMQEEHLVLSQSRSQRDQREENRQWVELRDNIAIEMWHQYSSRT